MNISEIKLNPKNPRIIKDEKFERLKKSIKEFPKMMELRPMIIDNENMVQGGNMRLKAIQELGYKEIPDSWVKKASELTEEELRKFKILDNASFGEWDWDELANEYEVEELVNWGVDVPNFFGQEEAQEDDYEIPETIETDIVLGDLFEIGNHRLLCGDSTNPDELATLMNSQKGDMVFTDPPYNIDYGNIKHPKFKIPNLENDNQTKEQFSSFCYLFAENIKKFSKGCVYVCGAPGNDGRIMFMALDETLHNSTTIIWNKDTFTLGRGKYQNKYEPIWFGWVNGGEGFTTERNLSNVWDIPRPKASKEHPTMKPVALVSEAIGHASRNSDIVIDLFAGSGTTCVAAHQMHRIAYMCEIDPKYCQVIIDRMLKLDPSLEIKKNGEKYVPREIVLQNTGNEQVINA